MLAVLVLFLIILTIKSVVVVEKHNEVVIEKKSGEFCVLRPGFHLILPFVTKIKAVVTLKEKTISFPAFIISKDGVNMSFECILFYQIFDSEKFVLQVKELTLTLQSAVESKLREIVETLEYEDVLSKRYSINSEVANKIALEDLGIKINYFELKDIELPKEVIEEYKRRIENEKRLKQKNDAVLNDSDITLNNGVCNTWCKNFKRYLENSEFDKLVTLFEKNVVYYKNKTQRLYTLEEIVADWKNILGSSMALVDFEILTETSNDAIINFNIRGKKQYDMLFKLEFTADGKCKNFRMWKQSE